MAAFDASRFSHKMGKYVFNLDQTIGEGGYGKVVAATNVETFEEVAIKLALEQAKQTSAELREVVLQACLAHEHVVPIKDIMFEKIAINPAYPSPGRVRPGVQAQLAVVMEKIDGGELFSTVVDEGGLSEDVARECFRQILLAMAYCHGRGVAHRDMKLENLLLTADKRNCKVCDFGLAKNLSESAHSTIIGTAKYVAPEVLQGAAYDGFKADIWSCGVCLYCMVECRFPFTAAGNDGVGGHNVHAASQSNLQLMRYLMEAKYPLKPERSAEFKTFLANILNPDPAARFTAADALNAPWMLTADWTVARVDETLGAMDHSAATVPGNYVSRDAWMAKVQELSGGGQEEETAAEDEEEGF